MPALLRRRRRQVLLATVAVMIVSSAVLVRAGLFYGRIQACFAQHETGPAIAYNDRSGSYNSVNIRIEPGWVASTWIGRYLGGSWAQVESVWIANPTRSELEAVASLRALLDVGIAGKVNAADSTWKRIGASPLEGIELNGTGLGDDNFRSLVRQKRAQYLFVKDETELTARGLDAISELTGLTQLTLIGELDADDRQWERILSNLEELELIFLYATGVGDRSVSSLAGMKSLEEAHIVDSSITNEGLSRLSGHPSLRRLVIRGGDISIDGVASLKENRALRALRIDSRGFSPSDVDHIKKLLPWCDVRITATPE